MGFEPEASPRAIITLATRQVRIEAGGETLHEGPLPTQTPPSCRRLPGAPRSGAAVADGAGRTNDDEKSDREFGPTGVVNPHPSDEPGDT